MKSMEIKCVTCGQTTLVRAEPIYEGFKKTGEAFICITCGHFYDSAEATPFICQAPRPTVFSDKDRFKVPIVFKDDERQHCCGWCQHFVINPFNQRCGQSNQETQATDICVRFKRKEP